MVTSSQLIDSFLELKKQIEKEGPTPQAEAVHKVLATMLRLVQTELKYREIKAEYPDIHIGFFDDDVDPDPVTSEDAKKMRSVSKDIGRALKKPRKA